MPYTVGLIAPAAPAVLDRWLDLNTYIEKIWSGAAWVGGAGGATGVTLVVAASNSLDPTRADYQCSGANDEVDINLALTAAAAVGGEVRLLEGTYNTAANIVVPVNVTLSGQGKATIIIAAGATISNAIVVNGNNVTIKDMKVTLAAGAGAVGTRPNVIYANTRTLIWLENLWLIGDTSVADDTSDVRQDGVCFITTTWSEIINCRIEDNDRHGVYLGTASNYNTVSGNTCQGNTRNGIYILSSDLNTVTGSTCQGNTLVGIYLSSANGNTITGNTCQGNTGDGILLLAAHQNTITGNTCHSNTGNGIALLTTDYNTVTGNTCHGNTENGIRILTSNWITITGNTCTQNNLMGNTYSGIIMDGSGHYNTITGNHCGKNGLHGIYLYKTGRCAVTGNDCDDQFTGDGIRVTGDGAGNADHNNIAGNTCNSNGAYGINIVGGVNANHNRVINNKLVGNTTAPFADAGRDTELAAYVVPFSDGTEAQDSGWLIDTDTEYARAWLRLPPEVQQVVRMRIYGRAVALSATTMALEINVNGGASNELFNTHPTAAPNTPSTTSNFAADDVIYWTLTSAQIIALLGGDSIEVKVLHEAADGGGVATNAYLRTAEFEYV